MKRPASKVARPQTASYEADIGDSHLLCRVTETKQAKPKPRRFYHKAPIFPMSSVPILKPGSALYEAFPTAFCIALGPDNKKRRDLAERLRLMSPDEGYVNNTLRKFLIVAMAYPESERVIFKPRRDESQCGTTGLEKLWDCLSNEAREPLSFRLPQPATGEWASALGLESDDKPVYQLPCVLSHLTILL